VTVTFATLQISFERLRQDRPSVSYLLSLMNFYNPVRIPKFLLRNLSDDKGEFEDDLEVLGGYLLVKMSNASDVSGMYQPVQLAIRARLYPLVERIGGGKISSPGCQKCFLRENLTIGPRCWLRFPHVESLAGKEFINVEETTLERLRSESNGALEDSRGESR